MKQRGRWLLAASGGLLLLLALSLGAAYLYQKEKISKIEFVFWDYEHENDANLSPGEIADYARKCGGRVEAAGPMLVVRYDGWFEHRHWSLTATSPPQGGKSS